MFFTVTIQTHNNADTLDITLRHLHTLQCPEQVDYEILVVDNNSSDGTSHVIRRHAELLRPRMRSVFEPQQGLSHARNRALRKAQGNVVCFVDDDVIVDPRWLHAMSAAFAGYSADVVGGRSYLILPDKGPQWLSPLAEGLLSRLDYGDSPLVNTDKDLYGLNFAVRRELAVDLGGFRTDLGRCGRSLACGEESDLLNRVRKHGGIVVYEPAAVVGHLVKPERLSKRWLLRRAYAGAVATERLSIERGQICSTARLAVHCMRCCASVCKSVLWRRDTAVELFEKQYHAAYSLGRLTATLSSRCSRKSPVLPERLMCTQ